MAALVQTRGLSKIYGKGENEVRALNDCSLYFTEGSFTSVVGRSGSGKTTLLHLLGGLDTPTQGSVEIEGRDIYRLSDSERTIFRRRRVGFVFQFYNLMPELTAYQNILLPIQLDNRKVDKEYLDEIISLLGLEGRLSHYPGELSGGQQQRVAIARALITKPAILLADEPTGNLDGKSGAEVLELLHLSRKRFHQTLIMVTHDRQIAEGADRIITLEDGRALNDTEGTRAAWGAAHKSVEAACKSGEADHKSGEAACKSREADHKSGAAGNLPPDKGSLLARPGAYDGREGR